tara:strand:+ start:2626 stop:3810 length:1185 start_codon:yes stop_codon:yes gene_type:complete
MSRLLEVFLQFLLLGSSSFGGPIAHLGYFHERFVQREHWLTEAAYADLVALSQLLPGPSSSQVGMGLGFLRAGWMGGVVAWVGFTLPSALLMIGAAALLSANPAWLNSSVIDGLKVAAVAVVAQAVLSLQRKLAPDRERICLMAFSAVLVLLVPLAWAPLLALLIGGVIGVTRLKPSGEELSPSDVLTVPLNRWVAMGLLGMVLVLFVTLPVLLANTEPIVLQQLGGFLQAGALVFGGGHVVLPLLEQSLVPQDWIGLDQFLVGYGAAQAVPGPMFSFAAFLGFDLRDGLHGIGGALLAVIALFLPSFLFIGGILPFWNQIGRLQTMRRALLGINAAVVGILLAALFEPIWQEGIQSNAEFSLGLIAFLMLVSWKQPAWRVVIFCGVMSGLWST